MKLVRFALQNPYTVIVAVLATVVIGVTCMLRMPVDLLPQFETPAVQVVTFYPGMPAEVMEKDITSRIERWTGQSMGIARQESRSMIGVSIVKDFFHSNISLASAIAQVSSYAMSDLFYLPPGTIPPMVMPFDPTATVPLALITVSSPTFGETRLYDVAYFDLRNRLQGISGVIAPAVYGGKLRRILAYVEPEKLQARGLSPVDVARALRRFSTMVPTGSAKLGGTDYQIITNGMPDRVEEMNAFPIKFEDGHPVFIRDVGEVRDAHQIQSNIVRISAPPDMTGKRQVYIPIYRQPGANTIEVVKGVRRALSSILKRLPEGINLGVVMDQSVYVRQAINNLVSEAAFGGLLAAVTIFLFLGNLRATLTAAFAIPLSILAAFIGLYVTGNSVNAMTLGGLALAVGRLVDDAVVVLENTYRHLEMGKTPNQAALEAAGEVSIPVFVATVTTMGVFFPVAFLTGIGKFLFTPLAAAVAFSIGASYFVAMTLVPVYCANFLKPKMSSKPATSNPVEAMGGSVGRAFELLRQRYRAALSRTLARPWPLLTGVAAAFVTALVLGTFLGRELFPAIDAGQLSIRVRGPRGMRIERTEELISRIESAIKDTIPQPELGMIISNIGVLYDWPAAYTPNAGPQDSFIEVQLTPERKESAQYYASRLRHVLAGRFPKADFSFHTGGILTAALNFGLPSPIDIQVSGNNLTVAHDIASRIAAEVRTVQGAADVRLQQQLDYPAIKVNIDRAKAAYLGLTSSEVVRNIVTSLNSSINFDPAFWIDKSNGNHYFLGAQYQESEIASLETLENMPVGSNLPVGPDPTVSRVASLNGRVGAGKGPVLLKNIASFERVNAPTEVNHLNISRVIDVFVNVAGRDVGSVASGVEAKIAPLISKLPRGYSVNVRGEVQSMREAFSGLWFGFFLATLLVYLVMVALFRSFLDPFIVMFAVPLGLIGVVAILLATGGTMNVQSFMGAIFMVGISVSNSVLLVEFANRLLARGTPASEAAVQAAAIRLRPILMTSLAAILGLLPMAIGLGHGSEANVPLARAVVGGLGVSTALTLFVVPVLYHILKGRPETVAATSKE